MVVTQPMITGMEKDSCVGHFKTIRWEDDPGRTMELRQR